LNKKIVLKRAESTIILQMKKTENINHPLYITESGLIDKKGYKFIIGIDEAGRGPGAGPVVAAAIRIPPERASALVGRIKDSKKMTKKQRDKMYVVLTTSYKYSIGIVDNKTIDKINILEATKLAMKEAVSGLPEADYALVDGNMKIDNLGLPYESIIKGDNICLSIAAGAIIAKVTRDRMMEKLHLEYPEYCWNSNKGYLTKKHIASIRENGITPHHRLSFNKVGK